MRATQRRPWWRRLLALAWPGHPDRWRDVPGRLRPTLVTVSRLTTGAVISYLITLVVTSGAVDLTGPLTALLVMQASAFSTVRMGAVRVGAVLTGVLVATLLSSWIGLTWWSLGAAIAASLLLGKVLRLGEQALETPISAMLILGVSDPSIAAEVRVLNTLIGAGVGITLNLVYPPAMPRQAAVRAVAGVADAAAALLDAAGHGFTAGPVSRDQIEDWLNGARRAGRQVAEATDVVTALRESRRLNPRALATTDVEPLLASGLATLERCLLAVRSLLASLQAEVPRQERPDDPLGEELRTAFAVVLHDVADCLRGFGGLVVAEAEGREEETERALDESLEVLRETQAILTELMLVDARDTTAAWLLRGSILAAVDRVLDQLNLEDRVRSRELWREQQQRRSLAHLPPLLQAALPHPDRPHLRGLPPGWSRRGAGVRGPSAPPGSSAPPPRQGSAER